MKSRIKRLFISSMFLLILSGCGGDKKPPVLTLQYNNEEYEALLGTYSWTYPGGGVEADADGPLGWKDMITTIQKDLEINELKLHFTKAPDEYQVRYWNDDHWDDYEAYAVNDYIKITKDILPLYNDDGYIYEVYATWKGKGDAYYGFYVIPSK